MLAAELFAATPAQYVTFFSLMPGAGSDEPNRNKTMMPSVKSSFLRRSGVRNARMNAVSMRDPSSSAEPAFQRLPYPTRRRPGGLARARRELARPRHERHEQAQANRAA